MKIGAVIQARIGSRRFHGKVLKPVCDRPILSHIIDRLTLCPDIEEIVVATSISEEDDAINNFCAREKVLCFRGSLDNVAQRLGDAATNQGFDAFVRISGDSPLIVPGHVSYAIKLFAGGRYDIVTNVFPRTFPSGQSVEVIDTTVLQRTTQKFNKQSHREHVTTYFYENWKLFRILNIQNYLDESHLDFAVDTPDDLERIMNVFWSVDRKSKVIREELFSTRLWEKQK